MNLKLAIDIMDELTETVIRSTGSLEWLEKVSDKEYLVGPPPEPVQNFGVQP